MNENTGKKGVESPGAVPQTVNEETVRRARQKLDEYKRGKAALEAKIVENEEWYKLRHWETLRGKRENEVEPSSAWLLNMILNKHADAMDNYPAPTVLPREEGDKAEAENLTSIIPVILEQNDFEEVYSDVMLTKEKTGAGVYGVFWDPEALHGLGEISITKVDLLNLFWEPGITDIQKSPNVFFVEKADNEMLLSAYPQLTGKLGGATGQLTEYKKDEQADDNGKSIVVDWYYKKRAGDRTLLHYCKFVNSEVLYASENDPAMFERGWYDHGLYPFVFDVLHKLPGTPAGFGYIDIAKNPQEYIDRAGQGILQNLLANTRPRHFIKNNGGVNEEEYADLKKDFVHVSGQLSDDNIRPIIGKPLSAVYVQVLQNKIDELKETTGNRDVNTGGHTAGVTAASAIAAMQEAGGKLSRDASRGSYRAYRLVILLVIELIRQFYSMPRQFRILGQNGEMQFSQYDNAGIRPRMQQLYDVEIGEKIPLFDVQVSAQRATAYSKMSQNEMSLQLYREGLFNPAMADQALLCIDMMDFDRKQEIAQKIARNGTLLQMVEQLRQQCLQLGGMVDAMRGTNEIVNSMMQQFGMAPAGEPIPTGGGNNTTAFSNNPAESRVTQKAREESAGASRI